MVRKIIILTIIFLLLNNGFSLYCASELQETPGTCITKTYTQVLSGSQAYYSCAKVIENTWWYYEPCTATVSSGTITTDQGSIVAEDWSNDANKVSACNGHNGWTCNVNPVFGFSDDFSLSYVGVCDSSDENCIKCEGVIESLAFDGNGLSITGSGDNSCESACGAELICDEIRQNTWTNRQINDIPLEAYCDNNCFVSDEKCEYDFGADIACDEIRIGEPCSEDYQDYCDNNNRLVDFSGNNVLETSYCQSDCTCDMTVDSVLCNTECGAHSNCQDHDIGYNIGDAGCDNYCNWLDCGIYSWNNLTNSCFTGCNQNSDCFGGSVCNLVSTHACFFDTTKPVVTQITPINNSRFNTNIIPYSFSVTDNGDVTLNCSYILNEASTNVGIVNHNSNFENTLSVSEEKWHNLKFKCVDDSGNTGYSETLKFLYDKSAPNYSNVSWQDLTWTIDNSLLVGDFVKINVLWSDNFELDYSQLWSNKYGVWNVEQVIYHHKEKSAQTSYYFDTTSYGDRNISFKIVAYDTSGNSNTTSEIPIHIYNPSNEISINIREEEEGNYSNCLEFEGNAQKVNNSKAIDSISTSLIGDFVVEHVGVGTMINNSFRLNEALPAGINIKISGDSNPENAVVLSTLNKHLSFCNNMIQNDTCEVWVWMDLYQEAIPPVTQLNNIIISSETI